MRSNVPERKTNKEARKFGRKTFVLAIISFFVSLAFAAFNAAMAIVSYSVWYASMASYYFILSVLRIFIVFYGAYIVRKYTGKELAKKQLRVYKFCGIWTVFMELALTAAIVHIIFSPRQPYGTVMAIAIATYSFYKILMAIKNLFKAKEYSDYCVQSLRNLAFVDAAVSMLSLTATLTATFGDPKEMQSLILAVGITIGALIIALGIFMAVKASRLMRRLKRE